MKILKTILLSAITLLPFSSPALAQVILQDNFAASSSGNWATRLGSSGNITFSDALVISTGNATVATAYRSFSTVSLADGQTLRMTFNVSVANELDRSYRIRFGLGFSNPLITGTSTTLTVPMSGYYAAFSTAPNTTAPSMNYVSANATNQKDFFSVETARIGNGPTNTSVSTTTQAVVLDITRVGGDLTFSGSLGATALSLGTATGANVLSNFEFNTVGFNNYLTSPTVSYTNFTLSVIPEPSTLAYLGGLMVVLFTIKRRQQTKSLT
jgi:hypothetical protein